MAVLHRIESLAGDGRFAVTFQRPDLSEQTAVVQVDGTQVRAAEASLPDGWTSGSDAFAALSAAVLAVHSARSSGPRGSTLIDVDGGWDVMMGNVVLEGRSPTCTAHGAMPSDGTTFSCAECGARARFAA